VPSPNRPACSEPTPNERRLTTLVKLPLILLLISSAALADKPKLVLLPLVAGEGASDTAAGKFTSVLTEEFKGRDDVLTLVPAPAAVRAVKAGPKGASNSANAEANAWIEAGKTALRNNELEAAADKLKKGIDAAMGDPASADVPLLVEAYVGLAAAQFRLGNQKDASTSLAGVVRLSHDFQLNSDYPPVFVRELEKARHKLDKLPRTSLSIEGPAGSTAYVDGRDLGMVPVVEENLPSGPHLVKVEGPRGERFGQTVELKSGMSKVRASFGGDGPAPAGVGDPRLASVIDAAFADRFLGWVQAAGAEFAVVGVVYRTGEQQLTGGLAVYNLKTKGFSVLSPLGFDAEVLTANVEAFRFADEIQKRIDNWPGNDRLPANLVTKPTVKAGSAAVAVSDVPLVVPERKAVKPKVTVDAPPEVPPVAVVEQPVNDLPPDEVKKGVPVWVWVAGGVALAAGAAVGSYFAISYATKPVSGTVTASW